MNTLDFIAQQYKVNIYQKRQPLEIPNATRETLARLFFDLGFTVGAEIGVEQGIYSEVLLKSNPNLQLFSIDAWQAYHGYRDHTTQKKMDEIYKNAMSRLETFIMDKKCIPIKGYSLEVANKVKDNSLDFVYIDANHEFQQVVNDICEWDKKVRIGGIVAGHDYIRRKTNGYLMHVPMAIHGFCESYQISPLFVLGRKQAHKNLDPKNGELRDYSRSWFYVKQERQEIVPNKKDLDNK